MPSSGKSEKTKLHSHEKNERKLQRKKKKEKMKLSEVELELSSTFCVEDELNLQLPSAISPPPVSVQLPEVPQAMKDQIRGLKDENGRLFQLLKEKDFEIRQLQKFKSENASSLKMPGLTSEIAATKIVELSKKLRETVAEMEKEKTKCKQLAKRCEDLKLQTATPKDCHIKLPVELCEEQKNAVEFKSLQDKLKQTESKMADWRNQCQILKQELKLANRVISQEVGEGFNLHSLASGKSTWKGRMQQILTSQQKISELKQQIDDLQCRNGNSIKETAVTERNSSNPTLRRFAQERKEAHDKVVSEHKELQEVHASLKNKCESVKARNQVLSNEIKMLKQQMKTLLEKGQHDDEMISTLMTQLSHMKEFMQENNQEKQQNDQQIKLKELSVTKQHDEYIVEQLNRIIAERDEKIRSLSNSLQVLSGEKTQKGEMFRLAPVANPNAEENNTESSVIQEYIFNSHNAGVNEADIYVEHPSLNSTRKKTPEKLTNNRNLNSGKGDQLKTVQDRLSAAEENIDVIEEEYAHLRRNRVLDNTIAEGEGVLQNNGIMNEEQYQVNFGGRKNILSIDTSIIDEDELQTVLEIEQDKKEAMKEVFKATQKSDLW